MSRVRTLAINASDHLVAMKRLEAAASILQNYLSAHDACPAVLRRLGRIRLAQQNPVEAAELFKRALSAYRESPAVGPADQAAATESST